MTDHSSDRPSLFADAALRRLLRMVLAQRGTLAVAFVAMLFTAATEPVMAKLTGVLLDQGFYARDNRAGIWIPAAFVGLFLVRGLSTFASSYLLTRISQNVLIDLRGAMFERLLRWPQTTLETMPSGTVISKFINEATNALNLAAEVLTTAVRDSLTVAALVGVLLYYNWKLTLLILIIGPLVALALRAFSQRLRRLNLENQKMVGEMTRAVQEAHEGSRVIKVYDGFAYESTRFGAINDKLRRFAMKMQVAYSAATPVTQIIAAVGLALIMGTALYQARATDFSPGDFMTFLTAALMLLQPLKHLTSLNGPIARRRAAGESVFAMIDTPREEDSGTREIGRARGAIEFASVSHRYAGTAAPALTDFSLRVEPGEMIALVGASGAGKTTVINLIPRFIEPSSGRLLIDGIDACALTLHSLRRQIALVSQDVVLFDDTIAANIAYGARAASDDEIRVAARAAHLLPFIESLPEGFRTRVGEGAVKLSGGQRQRLSIARALLKDAPILLLDEATSALDSESERYIQASLERLTSGRTTIVVAHRLSTIERADRIAVLEAGRLVELGAHRDLLARDGLYAKLRRIQFAQPEKADA
jgi:subfamily B ATP-binding cassette protein MsbA